MKTFKVIVADSQYANSMTYMKIKKTKGTKIVLKGFEKYKFMVHKTVERSIVDGKYSIVHLETGFRIATKNTIKDTKEEAEKILNIKGEKLFNEKIDERKGLYERFKIKYPVNKV